MLRLPLHTSELAEYLPHRSPMVWVDSVLEISERAGRCEVVLDPKKNYFSTSGLRPSSHIEFMAQAFAFVSLAREVLKQAAPLAKLSKTYLVGVNDFVCLTDIKTNDLTHVFVDVELTREFKPLLLLRGQVADAAGRVYASAGLKVYVEI